MLHLPGAFAPMASFRQFLGYRLESLPDGKLAKKPFDIRTGITSDPTDPSIWYDFQSASNAVSHLGPGHGVGFSFTDADPFWFLDIDHCIDAEGHHSDVAQWLCSEFKGAAVEISSSGKGLHLFGCGKAPAHGAGFR